ncbi:type I restriction-modification system subunit M [Eudoraea adriatica]|uniref:type I restriction-modification system subunit M n=1 Tax=Eudoraea adriatica TaxID=446681 RepID=UPI000372A0E3|nr:class I SAM-dependent DNA methyltransferase [Eudoraea adriatica]
MAIKKSELYSSLWDSCDELRGGMDASQYKDYVLTMLFVKYVSDKYAGNPMSLIEVPKGASFEDMVALKGQPDIGDRINKEILRPLFAANGLEGSMELVDFNDDDKLGSGKEKVDTLSKLIAIFENPGLNFKNNRAEDDDILGDAYEYLMRHFATESGKSKGQFYTPAEVSRILAKVINANQADKPSYTAYDPTCGSGSLLLKVAEEAPKGLTLYGQEKDIATKGLAIMNMWLHGYPEAAITGGNTIASPSFKENDGTLKRFDFVVANPPFSAKNWTSGINPRDDEFNRFRGYGIPPDKNGDYAFLLHIISSLKSTGKGAVILPHGVLFRGNAEAAIRKNILQRKWVKGIIGLPANLFYGTGIPACIIVIDKEHADSREGIFMIDASKGYIKDGPKNRLREQDLHKIVDAFNNQWEVDKYSRFVPFGEIEKNEYNLNIPRYIDTQEEEDIQDLNAHLTGGIPQKDIDALQEYWTVYPNLRRELFTQIREGYSKLNVEKAVIKSTIYEHPDFTQYNAKLDTLFKEYQGHNHPIMNAINEDTKPKAFIKTIAEDLLERYANKPLMVRYDVYQHLLDYWNETMKDDVYLLVEDGWKATVKRIIEKNKKSGKETDKGWTCDLIPKQLVIDKYLAEEQQAVQEIEARIEGIQAEITGYEEEHKDEEGLLNEATTDKGSITKTTINAFIQANKTNPDEKEAVALAKTVLDLITKEASLKKALKAKVAELDELTLVKFKELTEAEVRTLVVEDKWLTDLQAAIQTEIDAISQRLTGRVKELAERYENTLGELDNQTQTLEEKVAAHLEKMGLIWN